MSSESNILFIMADQLRCDYLSCYGHPSLQTPNLDKLAARGTKFSRAYAQSTVCGPSRMSFYTGRYVRSHGATYNDVPLRAGEMTLGDHLRDCGARTILVGKTHMAEDMSGFSRLGVEHTAQERRLAAECGFEVFEREEGVYPNRPGAKKFFESEYNNYLRGKGYEGANPWHDYVNSVEIDGEVVSGWFLESNSHPARARNEDTETPYLTRRALEAIDAQTSNGWCIHLSYIKPHWPYVAPAPYHNMYEGEDILPLVRSQEELEEPHPVYEAFSKTRVSQAFSREDVCAKVRPAYMGLIKQLDDELGNLFKGLEDRGLMENTMIVFTSDHGDYLGDHWLGEKDFMHEASVKIPMIIYDPRREADAVRGQSCQDLVEAIDLVPTFIDFMGGDTGSPWLQGQSLTPLLHGQKPEVWRSCAFSEYDYSSLPVRELVGAKIGECHFVCAVSDRYKFIYFPNFRPMLFDLIADPDELNDLAEEPSHQGIVREMERLTMRWLSKPNRVTESDASLLKRTNTQLSRGLPIGVINHEHHLIELEKEKR